MRGPEAIPNAAFEQYDTRVVRRPSQHANQTRWGGVAHNNEQPTSNKPPRHTAEGNSQRRRSNSGSYESRLLEAMRTEAELESDLASAKTEIQAVEAGLKVSLTCKAMHVECKFDLADSLADMYNIL